MPMSKLEYVESPLNVQLDFMDLMEPKNVLIHALLKCIKMIQEEHAKTALKIVQLAQI